MSAHTHFTPGPWRVLADGVTVFGKSDEIVDCSICSPILTEEAQLANARLISAAPDLLAALKAVMSGQIGGSPDMDAERFQAARAAIAKAEAP